jgi:REP element-mobilizing transposase RayT
VLTDLGHIAADTMSYMEQLYPIQIPVFIVMPDHVHLIVNLDRATARVAPTDSINLGRVIGAYKSKVSNQWLDSCKRRNQVMGKLWQRGYYEHVIRNQQDFLDCAAYIQGNPEAAAIRNFASRT